MARRKGARVLQVELPEDERRDDDEEEGGAVSETDDLIDEKLSESPVRATARLYRIHPRLNNGRQSYLDDVPLSEYSQRMVRETYGGGRYFVQFYGPIKGKGGKPSIGKRKTESFDVDLTIPPKAPPSAIENEPATGDDSAGRGRRSHRLDQALEGATMSVFQSMQTVGQMQSALVREMIETREARGIDWQQVGAVVSPLVLALIPHLFGRKEPDDLERLKTFAELMRPQQQDGGGTDVQRLRELHEFAKALSGGGAEEEPTAWTVARDVGKPLVELLASRVASGQLPQPQYQQPQLPAEGLSSTGGTEGMAFLGARLATVLEWAQGQFPVDWAADGLLHGVPETFYPAAIPLLENPGIVDRIVETDGRFAPHRLWLEALRLELLSAIRGDDDDSDNGADDSDGDNEPGITDEPGRGRGRKTDALPNGGVGEIESGSPGSQEGGGSSRGKRAK